MINSKVKYAKEFAGPSEVPFPSYRCKSSCIQPKNDKRVAVNHACKIVIDHPGDHFCICGLRWPSTTTKEKVS
jgi:hypothetical protein